MKDPPVPLIIGVECMKKLGKVTLDYSKECAKINGIQTPLGEAIEPTRKVTIAEKIQIPPRSEARVKGRVAATVTGPVLLDPNEDLAEKTKVLVARVIAIPINNEVPLRVINLTQEPQTLFPNMTVATIQDFEELPPRPCQPLPAEETEAFLGMFDWPSNLNEAELQALKNLIIEYHAAFAKSNTDLGCLKECPHQIELTGDPPPPARPYRVPQAQEAALREQLDKLLEANIIRPSSSPFQSPVVLVKKRDNSLRLCVDYRKLNKVSRNLIFPLPLIQDTLDRLGKSKLYSVLDLNQGFFQLQIHDDDIPKTAFTTPLGNFEFLRLPMGLKSSPASFQRAMNSIFSDILQSQLLVYLDDLIIHSCDFDQHLERLRNVLARLQFYNLKIKPKKCKFAQEKTEYLGHIISSDGIEPDKANIEKVANYPVPKTIKNVRAFLGIAGFYRRHIKDFAKIAAPLHGLIRKDNRFCWRTEHQNAFETLKNALITYPILAFPDFDKPFLLSTDASDVAIGAVLSQPYENGDRPVAYGSRVLNAAEKKYSCVERELLAIVHFLKTFRHFLWGRKFTIYTDHKPLQYLINHKDPSSRLMRWNLTMQDYDFEIKYCPGTKNGHADAMSRITHVTICATTRQQNPQLTEEQERTREKQEADPLYAALIAKLKGQALPAHMSPENRKFVRQHWEEFRLRKQLLYKLLPLGNLALCLTPDTAKQVWKEAHESLMGGHLATEKTLSKIQPKYFWRKMKENIEEWTKACNLCETRKVPHQYTRVPLQSLPIPAVPFTFCGVDFLGPLPETHLGNRHILLFTDYTSKWMEAASLPSQSATLTAQKFIELIVSRHGCPETLLSDRGRNFQSKLVAEICRLTKTNKISTCSYTPQCNGQTERANRTILDTMSFFVDELQKNWDVLLPFVLLALRTAKHASTKQSPFFLLYGRNARTPQDIWLGQPPSDNSEETLQQRMETFPVEMQHAWKVAREAVLKAQQQQKTQFDKRAVSSAEDFNIGDHVYIYQPNPKKGLSPKLQRCFRGPHRVVELQPSNARIVPVDSPRTKPQLVHLNRLKKAKSQRSGDERTDDQPQPSTSSAEPLAEDSNL